MVRIVERGRATLECCLIKRPLRRSDLPYQLGKLPPVFVIAGLAAIRGEVKLVPPLQFGTWRQRHLAGLLAADQVAADRDQRLASLGPQRGDDIGCSRT